MSDFSNMGDVNLAVKILQLLLLQENNATVQTEVQLGKLIAELHKRVNCS